MPTLEITPRERSALRAAAHPLRPVVLIGDNGLSDAVLKEIELNLNAHGLIKVRAGGQDRDARDEMLQTICDKLSCAAVHHLGKMLILYRPGSTKAVPGVEPETPAAAAKRRASEPHTPKKLAAEGKTLEKRSNRSPKKLEEEPDNKPKRFDPFAPVNKNGKPLRPGTRKVATGIPRRTGSAMSLRAGARSGGAGSGIARLAGGARKTVKK
ncbi:YhbY family RNA-binding protein [Schauerella aestuarii]|uniref:YhbY family RNA-binding protein n=1 Tax=Schauerella aestuarii TaxID=2511204 RepID=UPI00136A32FE|nr:YhbY family RNA-binding protein [Achromobacter aestuarii]MYZ45469.1 YhbY family RNA-binding protein [Achromobacter aestuarii]